MSRARARSSRAITTSSPLAEYPSLPGSREGPEGWDVPASQGGTVGSEVNDMRRSQTYDPELHDPGTPAAEGRCSHHAQGTAGCSQEAVVSFEDGDGRWQAGCRLAL